MSIIITAIIILALIKIIRDNLFYLWLWQIKEYRTDRMRAYLKDEGVGFIVPLGLWSQNARRLHRTIATMEPTVIYSIGLILILIFYFSRQLFIYLVSLFFAFAFYQILIEIKSRTLKRPRFTLRIFLTLFLSLLFYLFIAAVCRINNDLPAMSLILLLLFFYLITPILITAIILFTNPFFNFQKKRIIKKAAAKMRELKKIKVIGITGSYGKTSTKEFLDVILSEKYKVIKTVGNNNTNIGVARTVLNKVSDDYDYFICEMGAYKIGEIAEICGIVKPEVGILTGINEQHLDLFGSIENTIRAKFELIETLNRRGVAILNGDNKYIKSVIKNRELDIGYWILGGTIPPLKKEVREDSGLDKKIKNIILYSLKNISNIKVIPDRVEFIYKNQKFKAALLGKHYIENLLAAITAAENLGMNLEEISKAVEKIRPSKFMMRKLDGLNNSVFIDDSYSANPDGVIAALNYLDEAYQDYKKIIVFPGIIELGNKSEKVHRKLFNKIGKICDVAYMMKNQNAKRLHSPNGTMEPANNIGDKCKFIFEKSFDKVANLLKEDLNKKTVVLFESRGAGVVMKKLKIPKSTICSNFPKKDRTRQENNNQQKPIVS